MNASTWEDRMARRAAERAARRKAENPDPEDVSPHDQHLMQGHHWHVKSNYTVCSCGEMGGVFTVSVDPRWWSEDPAEVAQVEREETDFEAWICCRYCGEHGVIASDVTGVWPPASGRS